MAGSDQTKKPFKLRSQRWFDDPDDPGMTALYVERYLNFGLTRGELQSGKPIIGIAQTGSDIAPCNRHHLDLAKRVRDGITAAGGLPLEFPIHPIQETGKRPTAALDRNLAYLSLVEVLHGYPLDGVVLTTGCDKTTPACLMGAATVNIPAIVLSGGPMLDGHYQGRLTGSGTIVWAARKMLAAGRDQLRPLHGAGGQQRHHRRPLQHHGHGAVDELPGRGAGHVAARLRRHPGALPRARADGLRHRPAHRRDGAREPAPLRHHDAQARSRTRSSRRAPSAPAPTARRTSSPSPGTWAWSWRSRTGTASATTSRCWWTCQPAGRFLGEAFHRAGGVPAVMVELLEAGKLHGDAMTVTGRTVAENAEREVLVTGPRGDPAPTPSR